MKDYTNINKTLVKLLLFMIISVSYSIAFAQTITSSNDIKTIANKPLVKSDRTTLRHSLPSGDSDYNMRLKMHIRRDSKDDKHDLKRRERRLHRDRIPHNIPGR
jgi:hypothetical protein